MSTTYAPPSDSFPSGGSRYLLPHPAAGLPTGLDIEALAQHIRTSRRGRKISTAAPLSGSTKTRLPFFSSSSKEDSETRIPSPKPAPEPEPEEDYLLGKHSMYEDLEDAPAAPPYEPSTSFTDLPPSLGIRTDNIDHGLSAEYSSSSRSAAVSPGPSFPSYSQTSFLASGSSPPSPFFQDQARRPPLLARSQLSSPFALSPGYSSSAGGFHQTSHSFVSSSSSGGHTESFSTSQRGYDAFSPLGSFMTSQMPSLGLWQYSLAQPQEFGYTLRPMPRGLRTIFGLDCHCTRQSHRTPSSAIFNHRPESPPAADESKPSYGAQSLEGVWRLVNFMDSRSTTTPVDSYKQFPNGILYSLSPSSSTTLAPPLQRRFRGTGSIDNELADKSCAGLGVAGLLRNLNEVLGTTYELEGDIKALLCRYVEDPAMDFGSAYGELRRGWFSDVSTLRSRLDKGRRRDEDTRRRAIDMGRGLIVNPRITPRRVWDLYSNRVLPFWVLLSNDVPRNLWAVSHAWVELAERQHVKTRINREEWPVPIPNDVDLEQVRVELLNLGAEYVWLDVLCLRQKIRGDGDSGSPLSPQEVASEQLRAEEWKLDVPTIGHVYRCKPSQVVITYFSGLGRPFSIGHTTLKEDRAWLNRVWTMQETTPNWLLGGLTLEPFDDEGESISTVLTEFHGHMCNLLSSLSVEIPDIFALITFLLRRQGTNEIDFLGALGYLLKCPAIPIYDQKQSTEDAWDLLLQQLHPKHLTDLLIMYPDAGEGGQRRWRPSWKQLQAFCPEHTLPVTYSPRDLLQSPDPRVTSSSHGSSTITYSNSGYVIPHCRISGPSASETELRVPIGRPGTKGKSAGETFRIEPLGHGYTFSKEYCVVGVADLQYWVVGNIRKFDGSEMTFEKVGVFCISDPKERERLWHLNPGVSDVNISYV